MKFLSKEIQNLSTVATILNSTQQPGSIFVTPFRSRDFVQMTSEEPLNYHSVSKFFGVTFYFEVSYTIKDVNIVNNLFRILN